MKNRTMIVFTAIAVSVLLLGVLGVNALFPKAAPIPCPTADKIESVSITAEDGQCILLEQSRYMALLEYLSKAIPTRRPSVNDSPVADSWSMIEVYAKDRFYRYYIYEDDNDLYIELPYEGIYLAKTDHP